MYSLAEYLQWVFISSDILYKTQSVWVSTNCLHACSSPADIRSISSLLSFTPSVDLIFFFKIDTSAKAMALGFVIQVC